MTPVLDKYLTCHHTELWSGVVAHICNPSYVGGGDWEDSSFMPAQPNTVVHICNPSYIGGIGKRLTV
jgi:hypothetical protein